MTRGPRVLLPLALALAPLAGCASSPDPERRIAVSADAAPLVSASAIEVVVELPAPPGNVAVGPDGRVYFTFHPEARPAGTKLAELLPDGRVAPFPDAAWQTDRDDGPCFVTPLAVRVDARGRLWVLDHGDYGDETPTLTAFDLATREVAHRAELCDVADWGSMLNDLQVDAARDVVYIADTSAFDFDPAIVVYDVGARAARILLEDHPSVKPTSHHLVVQGMFLKLYGLPLEIAVDTIALSSDGERLVYGPLTGDRLYGVPTSALRDPALDEDAVAARVEDLGPKPASDGGTMDSAGNVYLTAIEHDAIVVRRPDGRLAVLAQDSELLAWPDGVALSPDERWLYVSVSELHRVLGQDPDDLPRHAPFRIVRIPLDALRD